ncbi:hypothetical protein O5286_29475, partial [Escherichia coli]|nr:hypothetical protein [Escherichia coli]
MVRVQLLGYRHNVPAGSESHFKVVLVSDRFIHLADYYFRQFLSPHLLCQCSQ